MKKEDIKKEMQNQNLPNQKKVMSLLNDLLKPAIDVPFENLQKAGEILELDVENLVISIEIFSLIKKELINNQNKITLKKLNSIGKLFSITTKNATKEEIINQILEIKID